MNICPFLELFFRSRFSCLTVAALAMLVNLPVLAQFPGLPGCSREFYRDVMAAEEMVNQSKSVEPLIALQQRYTNLTEQAWLEISIGLDYNQRTGVVNPSNAVIHFNAALEYDLLPEKTRIEILMWRGSSLEQLHKPTEALKDYLRGLLECSYYDIPAGWPQILSPKVQIYMSSFDPENSVRANDYNRYRKQLDFQRFLVQYRYTFIRGVKQVRQGKSDHEILEMLQAISPDSNRNTKIMESLKSENKQPWP